jgi:hypothetical protein
MSNEIVEVKPDIRNELSLNGADIERVVNHLAIVKEVVSKVLKEGKDGDSDYGVVPGTKKKALFKAGAEKLRMVFGLGVRFNLRASEFDRYENFARYTYDCEVFHLKSGTVIANCEGTANSQEKKYKERAVYIQGVYSGKENIPVSDIQNTLMKMAQKRAFVGAVIIATGASDYFTQDEDEIQEQEAQKKAASKADHSRFESTSNTNDYVIPIGKFKGKKLSEVDRKELNSYVEYMVANNPKIDGHLKNFVDAARDYLKT